MRSFPETDIDPKIDHQVKNNTRNLFVFVITIPEKYNKIPAIVLAVPGYLLNVF